MRSIAYLLSSIVLLGCGGAASVQPVRLRQVVLYQNGIGYFEHAGRAEGEIDLELQPHEIDDVLTTMTVVDESEGDGDAPIPSAVVPQDDDGERPRSLSIDVGDEPRDIRLAYAAQTAAWRASYRLVIPDDRGEGEALLQGWAVVDNTTAEDWDEVELVLATAAPLSFAVDLRTPRIVERPNVTGHHAPPVAFGPVRSEHADVEHDADGILDVDDLCPDEIEDMDGFEDYDGCPDPDNDHDRVLDVDDACPGDPETYNGMEDGDGCPDRGVVMIEDNALVILEKVYFEPDVAELRNVARPILDAIAATLRANPQIRRVEVQGHADRSEENPWSLSAERSATVRDALIERGVPERRLIAAPFGSTQPIDTGDSPDSQARNRRVEHQIVEHGDDRSGGEPSTPTQRPRMTSERLARTLRNAPLPQTGADGTRFVVRRRVSVPAGQSAMVAMVNSRLAGEDVLLYRPDGNVPHSDVHPFRAARLRNGDLDLVPGPIALFARGQFVGQGLLDRLEAGQRAFIPYALSTATRVEVEASDREIPSRVLSVGDGAFQVERIAVRTTRYEVRPGERPPARLFVTHPRSHGYEPHDAPPNTDTSATALLVPLPVNPNRRSELELSERKPVTSTVRLTGDFDISLREFALPEGLTEERRAALQQLVDDREALVASHLRSESLRARLAENGSRTAELRRSVRALVEVEGASATRRRLSRTLETAVQDGERLASELAQLRAEQVEARARLLEAARELRVASVE